MTGDQKRRGLLHGRAVDKVRQVFAELRRALGEEIPADEILMLAAALVDAAYPIERRDEHRRPSDRPASDHLPLDRAFSDGGWRVMHREFKWVAGPYRDDHPALAARATMIRPKTVHIRNQRLGILDTTEITTEPTTASAPNRASAGESLEEVISRLLKLNWDWVLPKPLPVTQNFDQDVVRVWSAHAPSWFELAARIPGIGERRPHGPAQ